MFPQDCVILDFFLKLCILNKVFLVREAVCVYVLLLICCLFSFLAQDVPQIWNHSLLSAASLEVIETRTGRGGLRYGEHRAACACAHVCSWRGESP